MDQLRTEKRLYLEYQKTESEMERLNRLIVAYEYSRHEVCAQRDGETKLRNICRTYWRVLKEKLNRTEAYTDEQQSRIDRLRQTVEVLEGELAAIEQDKKAALLRAREVSEFDTYVFGHII